MVGCQAGLAGASEEARETLARGSCWVTEKMTRLRPAEILQHGGSDPNLWADST